MHIQTHVLSGWCIGNIFSLNPRERFLCMLAASLPDLDGMGLLISIDFYWKYHHVFTHGILFIVVCSAILSYFSTARIKTFLIYFVLLHIHMIIDIFGSGEKWGIYYLWPFNSYLVETDYCWPFNSWQNILAGYSMVAVTVAVIYCKKRTPLEYIMPQLDKKIVNFFRAAKE